MVFSSPEPLFAPTVLTVPAFSACLSQDAFVPRGILRQYQGTSPHDAPWWIGMPAKTTEPSHLDALRYARIHKSGASLLKLRKSLALYRRQSLPIIGMQERVEVDMCPGLDVAKHASRLGIGTDVRESPAICHYSFSSACFSLSPHRHHRFWWRGLARCLRRPRPD